MTETTPTPTTTGDSNTTPPKKKMLLNAFAMNTPAHLSAGPWHHPRNHTSSYTQLSFWVSLARLLDRAGFHGLFLADTLGAYDIYRGPSNHVPTLRSGAQFPVNDPSYLVPSLTSATRNLIIGVTASTTYEAPYALARRLSTLDHLAHGRVAWNVVTSYLDSAARNFGRGSQIPHDERYAMADEYMEVLYKLWEGSFRDDAVVRDREAGVYIAADGVRQIDHRGKYFNVPGPHLCEPSAQRTPFLFQAGVSAAGNAFGGKHGEGIFVGGQTPEGVRGVVENVRREAREAGRKDDNVKVLAMVTVVVAATDEAAEAQRREFLRYADPDGTLALFGGWTGIDLSRFDEDQDLSVLDESPRLQSLVRRWSATVPGTDGLPWTKRRIVERLAIGGMGATIVGGPKTVADELERWMDVADLDGFNLGHVVNPGSFEDIIEHLLPELRRRGRFREAIENPGATAREVYIGTRRLPEDHPGSRFKWRAGEDVPAYQREEAKVEA